LKESVQIADDLIEHFMDYVPEIWAICDDVIVPDKEANKEMQKKAKQLNIIFFIVFCFPLCHPLYVIHPHTFQSGALTSFQDTNINVFKFINNWLYILSCLCVFSAPKTFFPLSTHQFFFTCGIFQGFHHKWKRFSVVHIVGQKPARF